MRVDARPHQRLDMDEIATDIPGGVCDLSRGRHDPEPPAGDRDRPIAQCEGSGGEPSGERGEQHRPAKHLASRI